MKRDMELVRKILLAVEEAEYDGGPIRIEIADRNSREVSYHIELLGEAALVETVDFSSFGGKDVQAVRLTWEGHEFLDASRDEGRWKRAMQTAGKVGGSLTFEALKELLKLGMREAVLRAGTL